MRDIARRLAEEKYPHYAAPSWGDGATKEDVTPSVDASWQGADADMQRAAFLAGWDAAIEHAVWIVENSRQVVPFNPSPGQSSNEGEKE